MHVAWAFAALLVADLCLGSDPARDGIMVEAVPYGIFSHAVINLFSTTYGNLF
jgi:hypothetical protein